VRRNDAEAAMVDPTAPRALPAAPGAQAACQDPDACRPARQTHDYHDQEPHRVPRSSGLRNAAAGLASSISAVRPPSCRGHLRRYESAPSLGSSARGVASPLVATDDRHRPTPIPGSRHRTIPWHVGVERRLRSPGSPSTCSSPARAAQASRFGSSTIRLRAPTCAWATTRASRGPARRPGSR